MSKGLLSISPLAVFLLVYLVSSLIAGDFYKVPVSAAFLVAGVWGVAVAEGPLTERLAAFSRGAGHPNVLLDTFSCLVQGLIPYGAQLLMAAGLAGISPAAIIPHLYYPFLMGLCALLSILFEKRPA